MNKLFLLLLLHILLFFNSFSQVCDCEKTFQWMIQTFEKNDAGFQYIIHKNGIDDYDRHTKQYIAKVKNVHLASVCQTLLTEWLHYFRPGHIGFYVKEPQADQSVNTEATIRNRFKNTATVNLNEEELKTLLEKKKNKLPIEGIWSSKGYRIGIVREEKPDTHFIAFILKADSVYWMPKQIKAKLKPVDKNHHFSVEYYKKDHSIEITKAELVTISGSLLNLYNTYWIREYPKVTLSQKENLLIKTNSAEIPFIEKLSEKTLYLRIPSFRMEEKKNIDSILALYDKQITTTVNLIIDIRNGTGGSDQSYRKLLPYLYTQAFRQIGVQLYATELSAQGYDKYASLFTDSETVKDCRSVATRMRANLGRFIDQSDHKFNLDSSYQVLPYPRQVAILCNKNNGSTDEQFLLDSKQSKKVKILGRPTGGMLDISNMNEVDSPDGIFELYYCMSKSYRIPDYCIDGVGIQPDVFMDDFIPEEDWIDYAQSYLEK